MSAALVHARVAEIVTHLDASRVVVEQAIESVPEHLRDRRPDPDRWSVAEVLEHLSIVDGQIAALFAARVGAARDAGLAAERETTPVSGMFKVHRMLDRSRRIESSERSLPLGQLGWRGAADAFIRQHDALRDTVLSLDGLALADVVATNPVFGPLNMYQWVLFAGGHEQRHAAQIVDIGTSLEHA